MCPSGIRAPAAPERETAGAEATCSASGGFVPHRRPPQTQQARARESHAPVRPRALYRMTVQTRKSRPAGHASAECDASHIDVLVIRERRVDRRAGARSRRRARAAELVRGAGVRPGRVRDLTGNLHIGVVTVELPTELCRRRHRRRRGPELAERDVVSRGGHADIGVTRAVVPLVGPVVEADHQGAGARVPGALPELVGPALRGAGGSHRQLPHVDCRAGERLALVVGDAVEDVVVAAAELDPVVEVDPVSREAGRRAAA